MSLAVGRYSSKAALFHRRRPQDPPVFNPRGAPAAFQPFTMAAFLCALARPSWARCSTCMSLLHHNRSYRGPPQTGQSTGHGAGRCPCAKQYALVAMPLKICCVACFRRPVREARAESMSDESFPPRCPGWFPHVKQQQSCSKRVAHQAGKGSLKWRCARRSARHSGGAGPPGVSHRQKLWQAQRRAESQRGSAGRGTFHVPSL